MVRAGQVIMPFEYDWVDYDALWYILGVLYAVLVMMSYRHDWKCIDNQTHLTVGSQEFLTIRGYADWTPVTQVVEGGETPLFKQYFAQWTEKDAQTGLGTVHKVEKVASE